MLAVVPIRCYAKLSRNQGAWITDCQWEDAQVENIACVHKCFLVGDRYCDPRTDWQADSKYAAYMHAMRANGRVAVIDSEYDPATGSFVSNGYVDVFDIDLRSLSPDNTPLSFRVVKRYTKR